MLTIHHRTTIITACYLGLILFVCSGIVATTAYANQQLERIWDHELNRWLNAEELGHLEVFFTEEEAAKVMFPDSDNIRKATLSLNSEQKELVEEQIGWKFPENSFTTYIGETGGKADGYAMVQNTIGKHRPITYMVGVDTEGEVTNFEVLVYREARGNEIATKRFNYQYEGKDIRDPIRINRDIINISGATMSVRSASAGVKRVLVLVNEFYLKPLGLGTNTLVAGNAEKGFLESILGF
ncbi:MAG: hypothetical protein NPIRA04_25320 [Nitrospirales bacterium]|nr:MAG: hypothetical protein NPIRA04_25320 [Nitrospirales bacterium]